MHLGVFLFGSRNGAALRAVCATLALMLAVLCAGAAQAGEIATTTANARAVIVADLTFFKVNDLQFGKIIAGATAGTVVVAPTGVRTVTGGVRLASGTTVQAAAFAGKGAVGQQVAIAITSTTVTLNRAGGGATMTMDTFIIGSTPTAQLTTSPTTFTIGNPTGIFQFPVGATLRVGANQAPGVYTGTFTLTLQYQ